MTTPLTSTEPSSAQLIHAARAELGRGLDSFLIGWFSTLCGPAEVQAAIASYRACHQ